MIHRIGARLAKWAQKWVPDPLLLALVLTMGVFVCGFALLWSNGHSPVTSAGVLSLAWVRGLSHAGGLAFAMQMCLVLLTGHAMATSPAVQRGIATLATIPRGTPDAAALVSLCACASGLVHWGLGAIVGAFLAREIYRLSKRAGRTLNLPVLGAAAYSGMAIWHGGLSGSAPLKIAETPVPPLDAPLALASTLLSPTNLVVSGLMLVCIPAFFWFLAPREVASPAHSVSLAPGSAEPSLSSKALARRDDEEDTDQGAADAWLGSLYLGRSLAATALISLGVALVVQDQRFDINSVNLLFFASGLLLQGSLKNYLGALRSGAQGVVGIIIQFPLYFGILGLMKSGGLVTGISKALVELSSDTTFPVVAFLSAGIVNLFVPSGGGQWAVQGEILMRAGNSLGIDPVTTVMAFSYGDAWTNMLQPFWALPLLGIMGLKAKDIIGYTAALFLLLALLIPGLLLIV